MPLNNLTNSAMLALQTAIEIAKESGNQQITPFHLAKSFLQHRSESIIESSKIC